MPASIRRAVGAVAMLLALFGTYSAFERARDVLERPPPGEFSAQAREQLALTAWILGIAPGSAEQRALESQSARALAKYHDHRLATLVHMVAGSLVLLAAFAQFSARARARWPAVHRWTGRLLLAMVLGAAGSGIFFAVGAPIGGALETGAGVVFGGFFLVAAARGWLAIRAGDRARHREWMIRMFATAIAIAVMRVMLLALLAATDLGVKAFEPEVFGALLWVGWLATLAAAEGYIRACRPRRPAGIEPAGLGANAT